MPEIFFRAITSLAQNPECNFQGFDHNYVLLYIDCILQIDVCVTCIMQDSPGFNIRSTKEYITGQQILPPPALVFAIDQEANSRETNQNKRLPNTRQPSQISPPMNLIGRQTSFSCIDLFSIAVEYHWDKFVEVMIISWHSEWDGS